VQPTGGHTRWDETLLFAFTYRQEHAWKHINRPCCGWFIRQKSNYIFKMFLQQIFAIYSHRLRLNPSESSRHSAFYPSLSRTGDVRQIRICLASFAYESLLTRGHFFITIATTLRFAPHSLVNGTIPRNVSIFASNVLSPSFLCLTVGKHIGKMRLYSTRRNTATFSHFLTTSNNNAYF